MPKFVIERDIPAAGKLSTNEESVREHAKKGGFPANRVSPVRTIIDPTTSE